MSEFDLDVKVKKAPDSVQPMITSRSLCTPGCITGFLGCFSRACNPTGGCSFTR